MSQEKGDEIFDLWKEIRTITQKASDANLTDVEMNLRIVGDILVQKYYKLGLPTRQSIHSLVWQEEEWPTKTAIYMELKSMLLEDEQNFSATPKNESNSAEKVMKMA